jgi:uncharacterized membrane protein
LKDRLGEGPYMGLYSIISLTGIVLIIISYESNSNFQYSINGKAYVYAKYFMFLALTLNIAAVMPTYIKKYTKHPMSLGIAIWAILHLLVNPDTTSIILFGSFLAYTTVSVVVAELRDSFSESVTPKVLYDIFAIVLGIALTFLTYNFHEYLSGVRLI